MEPLGELDALFEKLREKAARLARRERELVDDISWINGMINAAGFADPDADVERLLEEKIRSWRRGRKVRVDLQARINEVRGRRSALKRIRAEKRAVEQEKIRLLEEFSDAADPRSRELQRRVAELRLQNAS